MNDWTGQTTRHPSIVSGTLLLQAGSCVGALPWYLAQMTLPQICVICQQEAQICSPRALSAWLVVAVALTWSSKKPNTLPAKMPSSTNLVNL